MLDSKFLSHILILDDESGFGVLLRDELLREGYFVTLVNHYSEARTVISNEKVKVLVAEVKTTLFEESELLEFVKEISQKLPVFAIKIFRELETMVLAYKDGFSSYFNRPFKLGEVLFSIHQALQMGKG